MVRMPWHDNEKDKPDIGNAGGHEVHPIPEGAIVPVVDNRNDDNTNSDARQVPCILIESALNHAGSLTPSKSEYLVRSKQVKESPQDK